MEFLTQLYTWYQAHATDIVAVLIAIPPLGEAIVRLTPTEKDDGFVHRIGAFIDKILKFLPNNTKTP